MATAEEISTKILPEAFNAIRENRSALQKIAEYCCKSQTKNDYEQVYIQTQNYSKDALTNTAYHAHAIGVYLTKFFNVQFDQLDKLELQVNVLSNRLSVQKVKVGLAPFHAPVSLVQCPRGLKCHTTAKIPETSVPPDRFVHTVIDASIFSMPPYFNPNSVILSTAPFEMPISESKLENLMLVSNSKEKSFDTSESKKKRANTEIRQ